MGLTMRGRNKKRKMLQLTRSWNWLEYVLSGFSEVKSTLNYQKRLPELKKLSLAAHLRGPLGDQRAERRVARTHAPIDGRIGRRRHQLRPVRSLDTIGPITGRYARSGSWQVAQATAPDIVAEITLN
jgi:hypothetical protein